MKKLFFTVLTALFLGGTVCAQVITTLPNQQSTETQQKGKTCKKNPGYQPGMGLGPAIIPNQNMGLGPVNPAASNFYFAGNFIIVEGMPFFYDCMAGTIIPIATDQGIYSQIARDYEDNGYGGTEVYVKMRAFTIPNPNANLGEYPHQLVISYLNGMQPFRACDPAKTLCREWKTSLIGSHKGNVILFMGNDFSFKYIVETEGKTLTLNGSWYMTGVEEISFFFTEEFKYMGHSATINPNTMTLFLPTPTGTLIFDSGK